MAKTYPTIEQMATEGLGYIADLQDKLGSMTEPLIDLHARVLVEQAYTTNERELENLKLIIKNVEGARDLHRNLFQSLNAIQSNMGEVIKAQANLEAAKGGGR